MQRGRGSLLDALIRWSARTWAAGDDDRSEVYLEEWTAVLCDCPGPVTRWRVAATFAIGAAVNAQGQAFNHLYDAVCAFRARHLKRIERTAVVATFITIPAPFLGEIMSTRTGSLVPLYVALPLLLTTILLNMLWLGRRALRPQLFRRRK